MLRQAYDAFISYRSGDVALAEGLHERLHRAGFRVWFDKKRLHGGCDWHGEIEAGRDASRVILPVLTPGWRESEWCRYETYGGEYAIPLLFQGAWTEAAPVPLHRYQHIDLRAPREADWERLCQDLRDYLRRPRPEKPAQLASLPLRPNRHFVGRDALLVALH